LFARDCLVRGDQLALLLFPLDFGRVTPFPAFVDKAYGQVEIPAIASGPGSVRAVAVTPGKCKVEISWVP
jgi:hypothetical protein